MSESVSPLHTTPSERAAGIVARYAALAALAVGAERRFERTFETRLWRLEDGHTLVLTSLDDDFHSMRIALRVDERGTIAEAAGRMERNPYETCPRALEMLEALAGVSLASKPVEQTRARVPRTEGCLHLLDMLAVAYRAVRIAHGHDVPHAGEEGRRTLLQVLPHLRDTCASFAVEPPAVR